jgi:predicted transcriptional regulator of viral defense system
MQTNSHASLGQQKTLGPQSARLLAALHEKGRAVFTVADVQEVTGLGAKSTRNFVGKLVRRGVATRLKPGLFILVPYELGREREYLGNPYIVARALAGGRDYYLSHASAMDAHRMVTQPQLIVHVTSARPLRGRTILGTEFRFVRCKPEHLFGVAEHWVDKTEKVLISDLERTIIDGLKQPEYCGGIVQVAKGYWMRSRDMDIGRLVNYALRLDVGAVIRRLGYLLEACGVDEPAALERLRARVTATYHLLDPTLPVEGRRIARWRLRLNVSPEELQAVRST